MPWKVDGGNARQEQHLAFFRETCELSPGTRAVPTMTKAGLAASLASSVAALAASAANANDAPQMKAASKASARSGRAVPDPDQENARSRSRPAKGNKRARAAEAGAEAADADTPGHVGAMTHADQTRVLVSGLAEDVAAELIEDAFSDAGPVRHIKMGKGKATVHFVLATDAARCVAEMQGVEIAGQPLKLVLAESAESAAASAGGDGERTGDSNKAQPNYTKLNTRLFRLVIRNLPFGIKEAAVRSAFQRFGTLEEVHLPIKPGRDGKEQSRGFGFLQFSTRAEAKLALEQGNGTEILGRPVAVDWAVAKEIYQQAVPDKNKAAQGKGEGADQHVADSEAGGKKRKGGALEKEAGGKAEIDVNPEGRTVFIRNIPLEAEEHQVREVMRRFGKIVYLKLVIDKVTGKHKGSAFAQFSSAEAAEAACSAGGAFTGTESWEQVQRKKDKRLQSSAVRGVLDGFQETLSMFGRHLFVALAVDKKQAKELGAAEKQKLDPRNLHLAKIGVVLEDSPEAKNMPAADLAKRVRDWQEKKSKLANTNFSVNRTRLSVRNVAKGVTEAQLKAVFHDAVVRALAGAGGAASGKEKKDSAGDAANVGPVKVVGANLVRDKTKIDPATSLPLTKGYGFVEFTEHAHALLAVKHVNNSASVAKQHNAGKRLMVDFALDDARIVRQRRIKQVSHGPLSSSLLPE